MKREIQRFFLALVFFTRIPSPVRLEADQSSLERSHKYFPFIGWIVAGLTCGSFYLFQLILPISVALLIAFGIGFLVTGGFHEDGLNDSFDALGGGWEKEDSLRIMKDSRVGTFGVLSLFSVLLLKFFTLYELGTSSLFLLLAIWFNGQVASRFITTSFIQSHSYVQDPDQSKAKPLAEKGISAGAMLFSAFWGLLPLLLFWQHPYLALALIPAYLSKLFMARIFEKRIGGYTGDALGAVQQISELVFLISALALWNCIY